MESFFTVLVVGFGIATLVVIVGFILHGRRKHQYFAAAPRPHLGWCEHCGAREVSDPRHGLCARCRELRLEGFLGGGLPANGTNSLGNFAVAAPIFVVPTSTPQPARDAREERRPDPTPRPRREPSQGEEPDRAANAATEGEAPLCVRCGKNRVGENPRGGWFRYCSSCFVPRERDDDGDDDIRRRRDADRKREEELIAKTKGSSTPATGGKRSIFDVIGKS